MKQHALLPKTCFVLVVFLFVSGCFPLTPLPTKIKLTVFPTPTASPSGTPSPTPSATATPTATATKTPTLTRTITWTPRSTLPPAEARQLVQTLLSTNGGCELPCWWGLTPGQTHGAEIEAYLKTFALSLDRYDLKKRPLRQYSAVFPISTSTRWQDNLRASFYVTVNDDILDISAVGPGKPITEILAAYGQPAEVWLFSSGAPRGGSPEYELSLVYPERGIVASYSGLAALEAETFRLCPWLAAHAHSRFALWSPTSPRTLMEIFHSSKDEFYHQRIEEVSNLSVAQFYEAFLHPTGSPPTCLEAPIDNINVPDAPYFPTPTASPSGTPSPTPSPR